MMLLALSLLAALACAGPASVAEWESLAPGIELRSLAASDPSPVGDSRIVVLRFDPHAWQLELAGRSQTGRSSGQTARGWAKELGFVAVINAGMFASDHTTHVGYMESRGHVNSDKVNGYQSIAAFDPRDTEEHPPFRIFDLDRPGVSVDSIRKDYASLVQNLRLVKRPGENRWSKQDRRWSEAALGEDREGRILFVFSRSPFSMHELNRELLSARIGLVALQHLEGGPEAQLFVQVGEFELEMFGSYETSFRENDGNTLAWPIPNVLGIKRGTPTD